jgi:hypothetical protein
VVDLPADVPDPHLPVLALTLDGPPDVEPGLRADAVRPRITLAARDGSPHGPHVRFDEREGTVSGFVEPGDKLLWHVWLKAPGRHRVELEYAAGSAEAGDRIELAVLGQKLGAPLSDTGGEFRWTPLGTIQSDAAALEEARLSLPQPRRSAAIRVRSVRLSRLP